jgi:hypothetical protein
MPLLDHFHPPLHGPRRWEGFHHAWCTYIAQQLNDILPDEHYAVPELSQPIQSNEHEAPKPTAPPPTLTVPLDAANVNRYEVRVYQNLGGPNLRGVIALATPGDKASAVALRMFAVPWAHALSRGVGVVIVDIVTATKANLHEALLALIGVSGQQPVWQSPTRLSAVAYRVVKCHKASQIDVWTERLAIGQPLPVMPLWLSFDLCVPARLEDSYSTTCRSLRISA